MNRQTLILLILGFTLITSCKKNEEPELSEVEIWKLSWRMIENSMIKNYKVADLQFDSLRNMSNEMDRKYLLTGLKVKNKIGKNEEIIKILNTQDEVMLRKICSSEFLSNLKPCDGLLIEEIENEKLQDELIKMYVDDQAVRGNLMQDIINKYNIDTAKIKKNSGVMVDEQNRNRLKEIFKEIGFPTKKQVGKDAIQGIFFIIQHSDGDKEWQKSQLSNIEIAVQNGELDGQKYAYLYDRIKINNGEKQLYGTQFSNVDPINKTIELAETEYLENLDMRRMKIEMMPIEMYKKFMLKKL
mgnify:CR=1 FL=1|tara:strand:- start:280 stop:1176 length:897 start_codon:yes stop_codon:yes gene_type:complete